MEIEKLTKQTFSQATRPAPPSAWEAIERNLRQPAAKPRRHWPWALAALLATGAVALLTLSPKESPAPMAEAQPMADTAQPLLLAESTPSAAPAPQSPVAERKPSLPAAPQAPQAAAPSAVDQHVSPAPAAKMPLPVATPKPSPLPQPMPAASSYAAPAPQAPAATGPEPQPEHFPQPTEHEHEELAQVMPTLVSPNGDGVNDCFTIPGLERYDRVELSVFNAKNQRVYKTSLYDNSFCCDALPDGDYFYIARFTLKDRSTCVRRGHFMVLRQWWP